ncbi:MAG: hypothetical protein KGL01_10355 [Betaproteobacteria bacterium]|nr:hypothetical protein [Betaproteobacteria bacterium]
MNDVTFSVYMPSISAIQVAEEYVPPAILIVHGGRGSSAFHGTSKHAALVFLVFIAWCNKPAGKGCPVI